jgi:hypothetical protein
MLPLRHVDPKWESSSGHSAFIGSVSPILYRLVVPARFVKIHAGVQNLGGRANFHQFLWKLKILSRLLSVLSLRRKFVHDHCCHPNSATILTDSKMEAILDFWRGCQNLSIIQWGGGGAGVCGRGNEAQASCPCYRI